LYDKLCASLGRPFNLMHYWGPLASAKGSDWIASATSVLLSDPTLAPDLCLTYLPALDYDLQRFGPDSEKARSVLRTLLVELDQLFSTAVSNGYEVLIFGDYAIAQVSKGAVFPNKTLKEAGLFATRKIDGMLYPDFHLSRAFAVVDHEIAHVHIRDSAALELATQALQGTGGIGELLDRQKQQESGVAHSRSGELIAVAEEGSWFAYPWWQNDKEAPDYANHVDIHNKPGFDPCELFFGWPPFSVSRNTARIRGSHGRVGKGRDTCWAATCKFDREPESLLQLSEDVRSWLDR